MKRVFLFSMLALLLAQCGVRKNLPEGAPPKLKLNALLDSINAHENTVMYLRMRASASFTSPKQSQGFRLEVRLLRDSLIWIDLADPILGIKAARAVVFKDSVAFYNKINRQYLVGTISTLQRTLNFDFTFYDLQAILSANPVPKAYTPDELEAYPTTEAYLLANYPQEIENQQQVSALQEAFTRVFFAPTSYKPTIQEQREPVNGKSYTFICNEYAQKGNVVYPGNVKLEYVQQGQKSTLSYTVQQVETPENLSFPFSIPNGYAQLK